MSELINGLFEFQESREEFDEQDGMITQKCETLLAPFRESMSAPQYEQIRDVVFSIAQISRRSAFESGFKTAVRLMSDCLYEKPERNRE